jgi:nucleotide-binding universal stress UspA family protein
VREADIVVGVDGASSGVAALRWAVRQARLTGARLHAVTAWEIPAFYGWAPTFPYDDEMAATAGKLLAAAVRDALGDEPTEIDLVETAVPGHPAQVLIDASAHAALLVVGSRGHGGFTGALLGSVSQQCVHHARCPVVVIRDRR